MGNWPLSRGVALIVALFAVYFPVAVYLKHSHVPQPDPPKDRVWLTGPYVPLVEGGKAYLAWLPEFEGLADTLEEKHRSPIVLYENDRPLGPAHSPHKAITELGGGRYSHWPVVGVIFSSSDGSDPNQNWKLYWVRRPGNSDSNEKSSTIKQPVK